MASLGGLIHNFAITETVKYKNKYTLYKITSIVITDTNFPSLFSCFHSKINTWKRFNDIKKLHVDISRKIKDYNLKCSAPRLPEVSYFKRFDPEVVEERKQGILNFLYFVADYSILYQSQTFVKFFESGHPTPYSSPTHKSKEFDQIIESSDTKESELNTSMISSENSFDFEVGIERQPTDANSDVSSVQNEVNSYSEIESSEVSLDYLYEAAIEFSRAVQLEANCSFKEAFDKYKSGIDKLLTGAKNDFNDYRKKIAKQKAGKYLERAEQLYETHILNQDETDFIDISKAENETKNLERPMNQLSRFKVIKILDYVMQIQDVTDKKCYVMKVICKHIPNRLIYLPQNILYMVPLIGYFQSEDAIYLLLHLASGGKLWNYIKNYRVSKTRTFPSNLEDIFVEPTNKPLPILHSVDSGYSESIERESIESTYDTTKTFDDKHICLDDFLTDYDTVIPSFDTMSSQDMDVTDLVRCSQQLLNSVSKTLDRSKSQCDEQILKEVEIEQPVETAQEPSSLEINYIPIAQKLEEIIEPQLSSETESEDYYLPEECIKQWARELVVAVHSLHNSDVICGDLNFNNLLLGSNGELLLTYIYQNDKNHERFMCNLDSSAIKNLYVAPEHPNLTKSSDWWSVGVILFEMLTRKKFVSYHPSGTFHYFEIQYPDVFISNEAKDLLEGLLTPPDFRLDYDLIVSHPFFHNTNWTEIERNGIIKI